jgi:hypothetical protein
MGYIVRKGYKKKGYKRKAFDITRFGKKIHIPATTVKSASVPATKIKDVGAVGKTPESKKWFKQMGVELSGWKKHQSVTERRKKLRMAIKKHGKTAVWHRMLGLVNVNPDPEFDRVMKSDMNWYRSEFGTKHLKPTEAIAERLKMGENPYGKG